MSGPPIEIALTSPEDTTALARRIAQGLGAGDALLLEGPIGAGKSHFARGVIKARLAANGCDEDVPSPTFTLVQSYDVGGTEIWHADLYRLSDPTEIAELGLEDAFTDAICLVEWPDRLGDAAPEGAIILSFDPGKTDDTRVLRVTGNLDRWRGLMEQTEPARAG